MNSKQLSHNINTLRPHPQFLLQLSAYNLLFILILTFLLIAPIVNAQSVKIRFYNKTEYQIDSLNVNGVFLGTILPNSSSKLMEFQSFPFDGGYPDATATALINRIKVATPHFPRCGILLYSVKKGTYEFDIMVPENPPMKIYISNHQK